MPGPIFLAGDRVTFRTIEPDDVPFLHRWSNDPKMRRATGEQSVPLTLADEERYYEQISKDDDVIQLLVCLGEDPIGAVELAVVDSESDVAEIAYWLIPNRRKRGFARDSLSSFITYAFDELAIHRLHAEAFEFNARSIQLLGELGFRREGRLREAHFADGRRYDTLVFGLLTDEWSGDN